MLAITARELVMNHGEYPLRAILVAGRVAANINTPIKPKSRPSVGLLSLLSRERDRLAKVVIILANVRTQNALQTGSSIRFERKNEFG